MGGINLSKKSLLFVIFLLAFLPGVGGGKVLDFGICI